MNKLRFCLIFVEISTLAGITQDALCDVYTRVPLLPTAKAFEPFSLNMLANGESGCQNLMKAIVHPIYKEDKHFDEFLENFCRFVEMPKIDTITGITYNPSKMDIRLYGETRSSEVVVDDKRIYTYEMRLADRVSETRLTIPIVETTNQCWAVYPAAWTLYSVSTNCSEPIFKYNSISHESPEAAMFMSNICHVISSGKIVSLKKYFYPPSLKQKIADCKNTGGFEKTLTKRFVGMKNLELACYFPVEEELAKRLEYERSRGISLDDSYLYNLHIDGVSATKDNTYSIRMWIVEKSGTYQIIDFD